MNCTKSINASRRKILTFPSFLNTCGTCDGLTASPVIIYN